VGTRHEPRGCGQRTRQRPAGLDPTQQQPRQRLGAQPGQATAELRAQPRRRIAIWRAALPAPCANRARTQPAGAGVILPAAVHAREADKYGDGVGDRVPADMRRPAGRSPGRSRAAAASAAAAAAAAPGGRRRDGSRLIRYRATSEPRNFGMGRNVSWHWSWA
jgi:hypothetical protein